MEALSNELALAALNRVTEGVVLLRADTLEIRYASDAFCRMTGYRRDQLLGTLPDGLWGPNTDRRELARMRRAAREAQTARGEVVAYRPNGTEFVLGWYLEPLPAVGGEPPHLLGLALDRTRLREHERRRLDLEALAQVHREVAAGGVDLGTVRQRIADAARQTTGADAAVVEEPAGTDLIYRAAAGSARPHVGLRLPINGSISGTCYLSRDVLLCEDTHHDARADGKTAQVIGFRSGVLVPLTSGIRCYGVLKVYSSRPARFSQLHVTLLELISGVLASALQAAHSFQAEISRRHLLVDSLPMLIAYVDRDQHFREVNATYERWLGVPAAEIEGKTVEAFIGHRRYEALRPYIEAVLAGEQVRFETSIRLPDGSPGYMEGELTPDMDSVGRVRGFVSAVRDVTDARAANTDFLTGLSSRRKFEEQGAALVESARRYRRPLSLILLDIDHFKAVNDTFGHRIGDAVLKELAQIIRFEIRSADVPCRWGGEEFAVFAPETDDQDAGRLAERIRRRLAAHRFDEVGHVTASFGVAGMRPEEDLAALHHRADLALYEAKRLGRDRVVQASSARGS